ncbi:MAG TPA: cache domain-containing protein [Verrucomicrobiae bacterium]|nr:cache domain-containing protein [Verrucomicrobiae bacterium]
MVKKLLAFTTIAVLAVSLAGCTQKQPAPKTTEQNTAQAPATHPAETPAPQGGKVKQEDVEKKINDYLAKKYPGDWKVSGTTLSKGSYTENNNYKIVDEIADQFPGTMGVSIFIGEERVSTNVKQGTERVLKGYPTPPTVGEVMKSGTLTSTESSGYLKVYVPLKAANKTVAVLTVSVPQQ